MGALFPAPNSKNASRDVVIKITTIFWTSQLKSDCLQFFCKYGCCYSSVFEPVSKNSVASCISSTSKPSIWSYSLLFALSLVNQTRCCCCKSSGSQLSQLIWSHQLMMAQSVSLLLPHTCTHRMLLKHTSSSCSSSSFVWSSQCCVVRDVDLGFV